MRTLSFDESLTVGDVQELLQILSDVLDDDPREEGLVLLEAKLLAVQAICRAATLDQTAVALRIPPLQVDLRD